MARGFVLLLACVFLSGCFVFDEIDSGKKVMDQNSAKKPAASPATAGAPGQKPPGAPGAQPAGEWWAKAQSLNGPPSDPGGDNPAVHCKIGKSIRFMRKKDCLSQGGNAATL
jgi:hypothetical protein